MLGPHTNDFVFKQVSSILFGLIYLNQSYDQKGIMNINGALFLLQNQMSFGSVFPVVNASIPACRDSIMFIFVQIVFFFLFILDARFISVFVNC